MTKHNCKICNKKVGSLFVDVYTCKCKNIYCKEHIHGHYCNYNYRYEYKKDLQKLLVKIEPEKISTI